MNTMFIYYMSEIITVIVKNIVKIKNKYSYFFRILYEQIIYKTLISAFTIFSKSEKWVWFYQ